ncbi:hypothetical protein PCANC_01586 [Puccinia coronata f. sp. avenae]|nr:hypothetical protein PCASD_06434 [Puccinia coronata f. sp. avenae]PLW55759.1 hypothetical protein PCANC_01586 [Puccinia coronata f. sp. avenae]
MARQAISFSCILLILSMLVVFAIGHPVESMGLAKRTEPTLHNTLSKRKVRLDSVGGDVKNQMARGAPY